METYNNTIVKSNRMIKSYISHMSVTEYKILNHMIRTIKFGEEKLRSKEIDIIDFNYNALNRKTCKTLYSQFKKKLEDSLLDKKMYVPIDGKIEKYNIFSSAKPENGKVTMCMNEDMQKFLVDDDYLKKYYFTKIDATIFNNLNSFYSMRIYEIMLSLGDIPSECISIEILKKYLGISNKYKKFNDFKKRVLDMAIADINANSNIKMSFVLIKDGKKFSHINFKKRIIKNYKIPNENIQPENENKDEDKNVVVKHICEEFNKITPKYFLNEDLISKLVKEETEELVYKYLWDWKDYMNIKPMGNPAKVFYSAVKFKYDIWAEMKIKPHDAPNSKYHGKPIQSTNYEQRKYGDDHFEELENRSFEELRCVDETEQTNNHEKKTENKIEEEVKSVEQIILEGSAWVMAFADEISPVTSPEEIEKIDRLIIEKLIKKNPIFTFEQIIENNEFSNERKAIWYHISKNHESFNKV